MTDVLGKNFDPEKLFNLYLQLGSSWKLSRYLESIGIVNPNSGKRYTPETIRRTTWKWILDNPEYSFTLINQRFFSISSKYWEEFLVEKAYSVYFKICVSRERFDNWLRKNNLYDKYKDYGRIRSRDLGVVQKKVSD